MLALTIKTVLYYFNLKLKYILQKKIELNYLQHIYFVMKNGYEKEIHM